MMGLFSKKKPANVGAVTSSMIQGIVNQMDAQVMTGTAPVRPEVKKLWDMLLNLDDRLLYPYRTFLKMTCESGGHVVFIRNEVSVVQTTTFTDPTPQYVDCMHSWAEISTSFLSANPKYIAQLDESGYPMYIEGSDTTRMNLPAYDGKFANELFKLGQILMADAVRYAPLPTSVLPPVDHPMRKEEDKERIARVRRNKRIIKRGE